MKPNNKLCVAIFIGWAGLSAIAQTGIMPPIPISLGGQSSAPSVPIQIPPAQTLDDTFANRPQIFAASPPATNWIGGSLSNATSEVGEPMIDGVSSGQTVWGTWTAPSNGIVTLAVTADTFSPLLTVYAGAAPDANIISPLGAFPSSAETESVFTNLSLVASNNYLACYQDAPCGCHWRERDQITFHVTSGQAYQICVDAAIITDATWGFNQSPYYGWAVEQMTNIPVGGNFELGFQFTPAPKNDDFINRIKLSGSRISLTVSNTGATKQAGEPDHAGNPGGSSVWYSWTAPASGRVTLSTNEVPAYAPPTSTGGGYGDETFIFTPTAPTCGNLVDQNPPPIFYPVFAAYTGAAVISLTAADCLPMALDAFPNAIEFDVVKGQTYQIAFDGNLGTTGVIPFYLDLTPPAANDNFANRLPLHGIYVAATGYNAGATHQTGEPLFGNSTGKTVWWSWTAPVGGAVSLDLSGSDYAFPLAVFTGSSLAKLKTVAVDSGGLTFTAVAGQTYQIAVSDAAGLTGEIHLQLTAPVLQLVLLKANQARLNFNQTLYLTYAAIPGEVILFQSSADGVNWQNVQTLVATQASIQFAVRPAGNGSAPLYRAIIVDRHF